MPNGFDEAPAKPYNGSTIRNRGCTDSFREARQVIKSIKKATDILFLLSEAPETPVSVSRLAAELEINAATCVHILQTLCDSLLVERVSRKEGYRLGPGAYMLARHGRYQESLIEVCSPVLKWLNRQLGLTVFLSVVCDGVKFLNYHIDADGHVAFPDTQIVQGSIENSASGLLMMAYMDAESLNRVVYRSRSLTYDTVEKQRDRAQQIRKNGYADYHDPGRGRRSFAFAILNADKRPVASVGVLYADSADSPALRDRVITYGRYAAQEISRRLALSAEPLIHASPAE